MKSWPVLILLLGAAPAVQADTMRCGTRLVREEDTRDAVIERCGEPAEIQRTSVWRQPVVWLHGRPYRVGNDVIEVPVEIWIFNFGSHKLMRRVRFEDGLVVEITTLGYGYAR